MSTQTPLTAVQPRERLLAMLRGIPIGFFFGLGLEKSKVYLPEMKVFFSATAVGMIGISLLEHLQIAQRAPAKGQTLGFGELHGHGGNLLGGIIMGAGITLSGACPGTTIVQLAAGVPSAKYTLLGGLMAPIALSILHKRMQAKTPRFLQDTKSIFLDKWAKVPVIWLGGILAAFLLGGVYFLEQTFPWQLSASKVIANWTTPNISLSVINLLRAMAWPPIIAGTLIGLLQVPAILLTTHPLGASSSYVCFASWCYSQFDPEQKAVPYMKSYTKFTDWAQLGSMLGIALGSFTSVYISGMVPKNSSDTLSPVTYTLGGFLVILGARIAGGCASGHGLSGVGSLSVASLLTVAGMFAGAIAIAFLFPF